MYGKLLLRFRQSERHELAFKTSVVEAALLVGAASKAALKAGMRGDGGERPAGVAAEHLPHVMIERFACLAVAQTLAVRGIAQEGAALFRASAIAHIGDFKADASFQACLTEMTTRQLDGFRVDIRTGNALDKRRIKFGACLLTNSPNASVGISRQDSMAN